MTNTKLFLDYSVGISPARLLFFSGPENATAQKQKKLAKLVKKKEFYDKQIADLEWSLDNGYQDDDVTGESAEQLQDADSADLESYRKDLIKLKEKITQLQMNLGEKKQEVIEVTHEEIEKAKTLQTDGNKLVKTVSKNPKVAELQAVVADVENEKIQKSFKDDFKEIAEELEANYPHFESKYTRVPFYKDKRKHRGWNIPGKIGDQIDAGLSLKQIEKFVHDHEYTPPQYDKNDKLIHREDLNASHFFSEKEIHTLEDEMVKEDIDGFFEELPPMEDTFENEMNLGGSEEEVLAFLKSQEESEDLSNIIKNLNQKDAIYIEIFDLRTELAAFAPEGEKRKKAIKLENQLRTVNEDLKGEYLDDDDDDGLGMSETAAEKRASDEHWKNNYEKKLAKLYESNHKSEIQQKRGEIADKIAELSEIEKKLPAPDSKVFQLANYIFDKELRIENAVATILENLEHERLGHALLRFEKILRKANKLNSTEFEGEIPKEAWEAFKKAGLLSNGTWSQEKDESWTWQERIDAALQSDTINASKTEFKDRRYFPLGQITFEANEFSPWIQKTLFPAFGIEIKKITQKDVLMSFDKKGKKVRKDKTIYKLDVPREHEHLTWDEIFVALAEKYEKEIEQGDEAAAAKLAILKKEARDFGRVEMVFHGRADSISLEKFELNWLKSVVFGPGWVRNIFNAAVTATGWVYTFNSTSLPDADGLRDKLNLGKKEMRILRQAVQEASDTTDAKAVSEKLMEIIFIETGILKMPGTKNHIAGIAKQHFGIGPKAILALFRLLKGSKGSIDGSVGITEGGGGGSQLDKLTLQ